MTIRAALWNDPDWQIKSTLTVSKTLESFGLKTIGPPTTIRSTGRSFIQTIPTQDGNVWIKHSYALPPGENVVLYNLQKRWAKSLPDVLATWPGGIAMMPLPGSELNVDHPIEHWLAAAKSLAEIAEREKSHVNEWLALGVRDRRPKAFKLSVESMRKGVIVSSMDTNIRARFDKILPTLTDHYEQVFVTDATLVHQDSGSCNIHIYKTEPIFFDWADVVIGSPVFSCDRLLDQVPKPYREQVIQAFTGPLNLTISQYNKIRRLNVLHEILRYHDELVYLPSDDQVYLTLAKAIKSQIITLVNHEERM